MKLGDLPADSFRAVSLDIQQIGETLSISDHMLREMDLRVGRPLDPLSQHVIVSLVTRLASWRGESSITIPEIRVPSTWWDAFRARHFDVINRFFPVSYRVIQEQKTYHAEAMLPDVPLPSDTQPRRFDVMVRDFHPT